MKGRKEGDGRKRSEDGWKEEGKEEGQGSAGQGKEDLGLLWQ